MKSLTGEHSSKMSLQLQGAMKELPELASVFVERYIQLEKVKIARVCRLFSLELSVFIS